MRFVFLLFAFLLTTHLSSQSITGKIIDGQSGEPVSAAHIYDTQTGLGTISNQEGAFSLKLPEAKGMISLTISHIAYATKVLEANGQGELEIALVPDFTSLDEVVVKSSAGAMAKDIFQKLQGADNQNQFGRAFYRQTSMRDTLPTEWVESFIKLSYSPTGLKQMSVEQARVAEALPRSEDDCRFSFINFAYLTFIPLYRGEVSQAATPFSTFFDQYNFYIDEEYLKGSDTVVKLMFNPDDNIDAYAKTYGWVLYNQTQQKLLQMTLIMDNDLGMQLGQNDAGASLREAQYQFEFEFNQAESNLPELITVTYTADLHIKEQVHPYTIKATLIIYEPESKKHRKLYRPNIETNFYQEFREARYRPVFWKENPVIKRTTEEERIIQALEAAGAFGTYFKGKR